MPLSHAGRIVGTHASPGLLLQYQAARACAEDAQAEHFEGLTP